MTSLKNAKAELKSKSLPTAFMLRNTPSGVVAVNVNERDMWRVFDVMVKHGYRRVDTFVGTDTDYQVCFKPVKAGR